MLKKHKMLLVRIPGRPVFQGRISQENPRKDFPRELKGEKELARGKGEWGGGGRVREE